MTELERKMMNAIPEDDFFEDGLGSTLWTDCFIDCCGIDSKQARGVFSSLVQKGYILGGKKNFSLTEKGKDYIMRGEQQ